MLNVSSFAQKNSGYKALSFRISIYIHLSLFLNDNLSSKSMNFSISSTHLLTISLVGTTNYGGSNLGGFMFLFLKHFQRDYYCGY